MTLNVTKGKSKDTFPEDVESGKETDLLTEFMFELAEQPTVRVTVDTSMGSTLMVGLEGPLIGLEGPLVGLEGPLLGL